MKELKIVLTKSKKFLPIISWCIRLYTQKRYSHCARGFIALDDIEMYYQASEGKVNYESGKAFHKKHEIVKEYRISITEEQSKSITRSCLNDAGVKYGLLQNIGIMYVDLMKFFNIIVQNPWKSGKNCSEIVYANVLLLLFPDLDYNPDTIKPHHIEKIILERFEEKNGVWFPKPLLH